MNKQIFIISSNDKTDVDAFIKSKELTDRTVNEFIYELDYFGYEFYYENDLHIVTIKRIDQHLDFISNFTESLFSSTYRYFFIIEYNPRAGIIYNNIKDKDNL